MPPAAGWLAWFTPALLLALIADQISKWGLQWHIDAAGGIPDGWPGWIAWHHNTGVAWSMGAGNPGLVLLLTLVLVPVLTWTWWRHFRAHRLDNLGFGLVLGGALGNLIDRILAATGSHSVIGVRDFIHVDLGFWPFHPWPTFNLADSAICVGFALIVIRSLRPSRTQGA